jgi:hypothetical protein
MKSIKQTNKSELQIDMLQFYSKQHLRKYCTQSKPTTGMLLLTQTCFLYKKLVMALKDFQNFQNYRKYYT